MWYVYLVTNCINGKLYIGKTNDIEERWSRHKTIAKSDKVKYPLHLAIRKYGADNFIISILNHYEIESDALKNEIYFISQYKNDGYILYNATNGGEGVSGYKFSEDTKKILSSMKSGERNHRYGKHHSDEVKNKISASVKSTIAAKANKQ